MPETANPMIVILIVGVLMSVCAVSNISNHLNSKAHKLAHMKVKPEAPKGWTIAVVKEDGSTTYLKEHRHVFSEKRYLKAMAR